MNVKPINFKLNEYLSKGFEFFKKDIGGNIIAILFTMIMGFIPLCGMLGVGNFYKYCRKKMNGQPAEASEIFNFDDFVPYLYLQLIIIGFVLAMYIPFIFFIPFMGNNGGDPSPVFGMFFGIYALVLMVALFYLSVKIFYIPALISLRKVGDLKTAWNISKEMTNGNFINILLFIIVASFLGSLGVILCYVGIIVTLPFYYISTYFAYEDAMQQIDHDEIKEIGTKNEF